MKIYQPLSNRELLRRSREHNRTLREEVEKLKRDLSLVRDERDSLKALLDSQIDDALRRCVES